MPASKMQDVDYHPLLGMLLAAVLGGAVGIQRQAAQKPAGFRTHLMVAAACAVFAGMSAHLHETRIAANVLAGIGFIGAGAIVRTGFTAQGVTTAASIWTVAAIGVACGFGELYGAAAACALTVVALVALSFSDAALVAMLGFKKRATLVVTAALGERTVEEIAAVLRASGVQSEIASVQTTADTQSAGMEVRYHLQCRETAPLFALVRELSALPGVTAVNVAEAFFGG